MTTAEIIRNLEEIEQYIQGCMNNAAGGSKAYTRFRGWLYTVRSVLVTVKTEQEGDSK